MNTHQGQGTAQDKFKGKHLYAKKLFTLLHKLEI